jgi:DNA-binding transcriptional ArsR family regulator
VLALHTWPGQAGAEKEWTGPTYVSQRRLATLAGLSKDSVTAACRRLRELDLMTLERRLRERHEEGYKVYYRLSTTLYPRADEPYAVVPSNLAYGGTWALLPSPACRHLYLVIAGLDPIGDEEAYLARIAEDLDDDCDRRAENDDWEITDPTARAAAIQVKLLAAQRARHSLSIRDLVESSGLQPSTAVEALRALLVPMFGDRVEARTGRRSPPIALVQHGEPPPGRPTWYAPDRRAWDWSWQPRVMNSPERLS